MDPDALPSIEEVRAEKARRHLAEFIRQGWEIMEPGERLRWNWHIDAIAEHLEAVTRGQIRNLLINIPPGHMKSLIVSVFWPAWEWAQHPGTRSLFSSYSGDLALRDSVKCRLLVESDWYQQSFVRGEWGLSSDQNVKGFFQNTKLGFRIALSVGGKTTGYRASRIVVDDPLNAMDAYSKAKRDEAILWWDQAMSTRLSDPEKGVKVIIMQRLHEEDLAGHVLRQGGYEHLCLPSEFEPERRAVTSIGWADPRTKPGELLFPSMFTPAVIADAKRILGTSTGYPGQHQQRPMNADGALFKRAWWRRWRIPGQKVPEGMTTWLLPSRFDEVAISVDCAFKESDDTDRVAMGVWGKLGADKYLLDLVWDQMDFVTTCHSLLDLSTKWPAARAKFVEDKANGPAVINVLRNKIAGLIPVDPKGGKEARAAAASPEVEAGNVYVPLEAEWVQDFIAECASFPRGRNDDAVDQMTQMLARWTEVKPPSFAGISQVHHPRRM